MYTYVHALILKIEVHESTQIMLHVAVLEFEKGVVFGTEHACKLRQLKGFCRIFRHFSSKKDGTLRKGGDAEPGGIISWRRGMLEQY